MQVAAGTAIVSTVGWTGVGGVAGAALIVQGTASLVTGGYNLYVGSNEVNTSGAIGAVTSLITDNATANDIATVVDMGINLAVGGAAIKAANGAVQAKIRSGTINGYIAEYNNIFPDGVHLYDSSIFKNMLSATGSLSSVVNSTNKMLE